MPGQIGRGFEDVRILVLFLSLKANLEVK